MPSSTRSCGLCGAQAHWVCRQRLLARHDVDYFLCPACDLLQTEAPYWLDEAYARAISQLDTGAVQRNQETSRLTLLLAAVRGVGGGARCLDVGGGHGVFVRMMRDLGLDFRWYDKHADNLFAHGFEGAPDERYALGPAFAGHEHLAEPRADLERLFGPGHDFILVATLLHAGHQPGWWYYMNESGQHVVFYGRRTMAFIAERFGYDALVGPTHTLFVRRGVPLGAARRALLRGALGRPSLAEALVALVPAPLRRQLLPYRSRVQPDHDALRAALGRTRL